AVHPESYKIVEKMAKDLKISTQNLIGNESEISKIDLNKYVLEHVGMLTLKDILNELKKPGLDSRKKAVIVQFDKNIKKIEDLKTGMKLQGIINNITNF